MRKSVLAVMLLCSAAFPPASDAQDAKPAEKSGSFTGATANMAPGDPAGQWTRQARDYANTRYSPLTQINKANVARLRVA
ncbi:MAG TPA: hypothetical protein VEV64_04475, partial [Rhizomicrobium sp.]|nr:hypothetical protein [Rhizomicrobium sp.]